MLSWELAFQPTATAQGNSDDRLKATVSTQVVDFDERERAARLAFQTNC